MYDDENQRTENEIPESAKIAEKADEATARELDEVFRKGRGSVEDKPKKRRKREGHLFA